MNFAESQFWLWLIGGLGVILLSKALLGRWLGARIMTFDKLALMGLGLFLLLCVSRVTFLIFLTVAVVSYWGLWWVRRHDKAHRRRYLFVLIPLQLLPLLYYKYADFLLNQTLALDFSSLHNLLIPVGISFYTFQKVAFVLDTLAFDKPLPAFLDYMNFAAFFPQIVAGPIERRENLLPQMEQFRFRWVPEWINEGAGFIALGLFFKCCLANTLALYFDGTSTSNPFSIWLANLVFGLRIYYDFAGYSLVAVGVGRCLGVRLTLNFLSPYCAVSMVEFWRRWHVTLSQWFRDYVYVPLGGGRTRWWACNVAVVFIVSGVWHGAGWNFVLWGAVHGACLIANRLFGSRLRLPRLPSWLLTLTAAFAAWLCFYETRTPFLIAKIKTLFTPWDYTAAALRETLAYRGASDLFVLCCFLCLTTMVLLVEWLSIARKDEPYYYLRRPWTIALLVILTVLLSPERDNGFIYFAF